MSLHAIDFPHLRVGNALIKQSLLYPTAAPVTPNKNSDDDEEDEYESINIHNHNYNTNSSPRKMTSSSATIANGSSDSHSSNTNNYPSKHQQQQQKPIYVDIETMRMQLSILATQLQSRVSIDTIRPLHVFLGLNQTAGYCLSPTAFTPPVRLSSKKIIDKTTPEKIKSRVQLNVAYFISNYALLAIMTGIVIALMHPGMVLFVGMVYTLWMGHHFLIRNPLIVFGIEVHSLLSIQQRFYFLFTMTTIVVVWKCLAPTLFFICISGILILSHSLLRDPKDVEASGNIDRHNKRVDSDDDDDIEGGIHDDSTSGTTTTTTTTSLMDRSGVKSPGAEKRRNAVSSSNDLLSKQ